ncbi:molybdopterin-guanine dinucleotide biosynthesis protein B [Ahrensia sp. R2A130]|uniref:molybdopterin-guanine dinucleotide biosynthesis protein B n=1 Tax=Ahrensia sp. R2A130 TaxID=744979 RepID=UPI0001E0F078|nr:molybdopterin-guanine dinucleotide biosynthesis protein B [Ahrensia sp. R2A130]EFL90434.1 molybdopterin-guanine dinucleotide biosynthesis protein B [Ahrensia sp. R2A130]
MRSDAKAVFGITGWKNTGKTTLVERLVEHLTASGLKVSTIKRAHHSFDIDREGTDSFRHRKAGAQEVAIVGQQRWALMHEGGGSETELEDMLARLAPCDLVLVEGFKASPISKIECMGETRADRPPVHAEHPSVVALANTAADNTCALPQFRRDDITAIAAFICAQTGLRR